MSIAKPTALKVVTATGRDVVGHRSVKAEPKSAQLAECPRPPKRFDGDPLATAHFRRLGKLTVGMKVLTTADMVALEKLAWESARLEELQESLPIGSFTTLTEKTGVEHISPRFRAMMDLSASVDRGLRQFGATPSARSTLRVAPTDKPKDDWSEL